MKRLVVLGVLLLASPAQADFDAGLSAAIKGDYATAFDEFRPLAEEGHARAQNNLGVMYQHGQGVAQDFAEARRWYHKAARQGNPEAPYNLGLMYLRGDGVPRDDLRAYMWFEIASGLGDKMAAERRDETAQRLTPEHIAEARRRAREWLEEEGGE